MAYFNFNYVTDPPNDELVNYQTQLNNNWTEVNNKIKGFNVLPTTLVNPPVGTEAYFPEAPSTDNWRIAVYDGTAWRRAINHTSGFTAWLPITLRSPVVARPGFPPMAKLDLVNRRVILSGGVLYGAAAPAWPYTTTEITDDLAFDSSVNPVNGGLSIQQGTTGPITTANGFSSAVVYAEALTTPAPRVSIKVRYQGDAGGGNFVMLDGISWWF